MPDASQPSPSPSPSPSLHSLLVSAEVAEEVPFAIPGATPGGVFAQLLNLDAGAGLVATVIRLGPGARIPAHWHARGAEAHYVLEGDFIEGGVVLGPGTFLTHPAGVVHGPHESRRGCRVLTLQTAYVDPADPDFHVVEGNAR